MKFILLAAIAAVLSLPVTPMMAKTGSGLAMPLGFGDSQPAERRSGRCTGGEARFFVVGCGGV